MTDNAEFSVIYRVVRSKCREYLPFLVQGSLQECVAGIGREIEGLLGQLNPSLGPVFCFP